MAVSTGTKAVHSDWVSAAWAVRNDISVSVTSHEFVSILI